MKRKLFFALTLCAIAVVLIATLPAERKPTLNLAAAIQRPPGMVAINHIVFIIKENRTFDHYFGAFPGADGASSGVTADGRTIPLRRPPDQTPHDIDHTWFGALTAINGGKMNGFDISNPQTVVVTNTGSQTLTFASIVATGYFSQTNNCTAGVPAGGSCSINIVFKPATAATLTGSIVLNDNDNTGPQSISLTGTGIS